ncbi:hypothetical protein COV82_01635 [Candidatus Peregrinibacteria bacterium CG11_big_fil_rev_8_21_14_0_20_46_8]|nr:MAG: hypothetical protein COV82_01635 [Candidatus Peregrinibacteria bacterium CG11_big_fil_rev_8_21_14_0_20_46_8]
MNRPDTIQDTKRTTKRRPARLSPAQQVTLLLGMGIGASMVPLVQHAAERMMRPAPYIPVPSTEQAIVIDNPLAVQPLLQTVERTVSLIQENCFSLVEGCLKKDTCGFQTWGNTKRWQKHYVGSPRTFPNDAQCVLEHQRDTNILTIALRVHGKMNGRVSYNINNRRTAAENLQTKYLDKNGQQEVRCDFLPKFTCEILTETANGQRVRRSFSADHQLFTQKILINANTANEKYAAIRAELHARRRQR